MPLCCHNEYMNYIEINYIKINYLILKKLIVYFWREKNKIFQKVELIILFSRSF